MGKLYKILLIWALIFGFLFRIYKINNPVADWHSFRQADTASVTRNFLIKGIDLFHPTYHDLSNLQSGRDNPNGYRMVEFPLYNLFSVEFYKAGRFLLPWLTIESASRLVSIIFSLFSALVIFGIVFRITGNFWPSFIALCVFLFLPFNIYYSRTILPGSTAVLFMVLSMYFISSNIFVSAIFLALSILAKPYTALISAPFLALQIIFPLFRSRKISPARILSYIAFALIALLPFFLWRRWITNYPEGIPYSDWLLNNSTHDVFPSWFHGYNLSWLNKIVAFRPYWFRWLFYERLGKLIFGFFGAIPFIFGFVFNRGKSRLYSLTLFGGILIYFIIVAQGNIQHDYYQMLIIPNLAIIIGFGLYNLFHLLPKFKYLSIFFAVSIISLSFYFSWHQIREYYKINNPSIIAAGREADLILPKNALVVAPYTGDTAFLYQTNRAGYPIEIYDFDKIKKEHPNTPFYLVSVNFDNYTNNLIKRYKTVYKNNKYIILDLNQR